MANQKKDLHEQLPQSKIRFHQGFDIACFTASGLSMYFGSGKTLEKFTSIFEFTFQIMRFLSS